MSLNRFATKVDATQKDIVTGLRGMRIEVWIIKKPCDLLLRFYCNRHHDFCWQTLECKPLSGKREPKVRFRTDQNEQTAFLLDTNTPVAASFEEAWRKLNLRHHLGAITT